MAAFRAVEKLKATRPKPQRAPATVEGFEKELERRREQNEIVRADGTGAEALTAARDRARQRTA